MHKLEESRKKILVVDSCPQIGDLCLMSVDYNHSVTAVRNTAAALKALDLGSYDLVIVNSDDIRIDEVQVVRAIKKPARIVSTNKHATSICITSSRFDNETKRFAKTIGADYVVDRTGGLQPFLESYCSGEVMQDAVLKSAKPELCA